MKTRQLATTVLSVLALGTAAACGNLTPGGLADVSVWLSGDADTLSAAAAQLAAPPATASAPALSSGPAQSAEEAEGQIEVEFLVYLISEAGTQLQLGDGPMHVNADLRGRTEADVVDRQEIPAVPYTELQLLFTKIHAEVEGLVIDGQPVTEVDVELEHVSLLVNRALELSLQDGQSVDLVVDLNSLAWLDAVDPVTGAVNESVFADLVHVVVR